MPLLGEVGVVREMGLGRAVFPHQLQARHLGSVSESPQAGLGGAVNESAVLRKTSLTAPTVVERTF